MNIDAKISITTACGARCATCPSWKQPQHTMSLEDFEIVYTKLSQSPLIGRILINGTGDITAIPGWGKYFDVIRKHKTKFTTMTTNAAGLHFVPDGLDELIISFNGGTPETYKASTGLDFEAVAGTIRGLYPSFGKLENLEMHCLIWAGTEGDREAFIEYWRDFPGALRISYKTDNQGEGYFGIDRARDDNRIPCDYLSNIIVTYDGRVASCCHDWDNKTNFGNLFNQSVPEVLRSPARNRMVAEHMQGVYLGICEHCNYNVRTGGKMEYA